MDGLLPHNLHCITAAKLFSTTYIREPRKGGGKKWPMCRSGLWERGLVFRRWRALLPNERVSGVALGVLHVEGIFDGSLMGGREGGDLCGGLVVVVVVVLVLETRKERGV